MLSARLTRARHPGGPPMNGRIVIRIPRGVKRRLRRQMQKTRDAAFRTRVQIVLLYEAGMGAQRIAANLGRVPATAVRVARRFLEQGEDGVLAASRDTGEVKDDAYVEPA